MDKIFVIVKRPGCMPETEYIDNTLEEFQRLVGGVHRGIGSCDRPRDHLQRGGSSDGSGIQLCDLRRVLCGDYRAGSDEARQICVRAVSHLYVQTAAAIVDGGITC